MGRCVIFCAGGFDGLTAPLTENDYIIAADGGYVHAQALGLTPDCILGDFDSLGYVPQAAIQFPVEKDDTDAMLAVRHGLDLGYTQFLLYGSLEGPRLDHTVANFQTLQYLADHGAQGYLIGKHQVVTVLREGSMQFPTGCQGDISLFCMGEAARGIDLEGLHYCLTDGTLESGFPLGVSNHFTDAAAKVTVRQGSLLIIFDRQNGLVWK